MKKKIICVVLSIFIFASQATSVFAYYAYSDETVIGSYQTTLETEMWHYSGGYWILAGGTNYEQTITDAELGAAMNVLGYLQSNYVTFEFTLPDEVKTARDSGLYITFAPTTEVHDISTFFDTESMYGEIVDDTLYLYAKQKLPLCGVKTFDDYVSGLACTLPLVDFNYGWNLYSIYKKGSLLGTARGGYYSNETQVKIIDSLMHPYMIQDSTGKLRNSYMIQLSNGRFFYPSSHYVGWGTFKNGGAVGCRFTYTFNIEYRSCNRVWVDDTIVEPEPETKWLIHRRK